MFSFPAGAQARETVSVGLAIFNMAWAGTVDDFKRHVEVCSAPAVNWCASRAKAMRGPWHLQAEEASRAKRCREATMEAAGSSREMQMTAPCNAYGKRSAKAPQPMDVMVESYRAKLAGLRATVENLIGNENVEIIAFQEVKSREVVEQVLGRFAEEFETCVAPHDAFQTVAFAWKKAVSSEAGRCIPNHELAIAENAEEGAISYSVRPGLALELVINGEPVTFLDVHLKSGCANLATAHGFAGRKLTDPDPACEILNRQLPVIEDWVEDVARHSPRFVLLGDFNRKIDEEERAGIAPDEVRTDGSDPAGPNTRDTWGRVKSSYFWQEIADGSPGLHQVPLILTGKGCGGYDGLDHIVISESIRQMQRLPLSSRKVPLVKSHRQSIKTSDHCPRVAVLEF
ncbi:MAG TPA: endonuclease/exonuclease/phosphatase family protein [Nitrosospira sp.]|nr:endonuclease/exonuclease/phosphatase family protein [Nitrosospira sp.]